MSAPSFAAVAAEYASRWRAMKVLANVVASLRGIVNTIIANKARYQAVEKLTGVPWFFIGAIHYREASCNFHCHLHNGDPLTARTRQVPAGRPLKGEAPFTWEESAVDALTMRGLKAGKITSVETFAFEAEGYNGWGYRGKGVTSPYLWAGTSEHERGKYVADHVYDATAIDKEEGVMPILQLLMQADASIFAPVSLPTPTPINAPAASPEAPISPPKPETGGWAAVIAKVLLAILGALFRKKS